MKIATNIKQVQGFGYQLIIEEQTLLGINIIMDGKILIKKRFLSKIQLSLDSEQQLLKELIIEIFRNKK